MAKILQRDCLTRRAESHWSGRHVAVTGGTSGIGLETTRNLLSAGALVTAIGLPDAALERLRSESQENLVVAAADVTDTGQLHEAIEHGRSSHGPLGALVTCAGLVKPGYFDELTDDDLRRHMEINYFGTVHAIRLALPDLRAASGASITCVSSAAGFLGVFGYAAYSPSKFAVTGLCEVLRQELRPHGISVSVVYPTDVETPMLAQESTEKPPELRALSPGENSLTVSQVATALLNGTAVDRARILPGLGPWALHFAVRAAPRLLSVYMDSTIRKARQGIRTTGAAPPAKQQPPRRT